MKESVRELPKVRQALLGMGAIMSTQSRSLLTFALCTLVGHRIPALFFAAVIEAPAVRSGRLGQLKAGGR